MMPTSFEQVLPPGIPYQVVARRYRPQDFDQLVGQEHITQALSNAITTGRIGHAYLFTGARGVGKTSSARIFAKSLNCMTGPTPHPCNECEICQSISVGEDIDVIEIDGASNRGIDEIRQLRQNASISPSRSKFKIYIIDEVHMLTREAFNALLKTLEEPPEHVKFIFCTTEPTKIPITILSRCQRFDFAGIDSGKIADRLAEIAAREKVTAEEGVFATLARRASGSMRDAQSLLEQLLSFAPEHIRLLDVHEMLGTANEQRLFRLLEGLLAAEPMVVFTELDAAAEEGVDFGVLIEQIMGIFRDLMLIASGGEADLLIFSDPQQYDVLNGMAKGFGLQRILAALQLLDQTYNRMRYSTQGRILAELALVRIAYLGDLQHVAALLEQLRSGINPVIPAGSSPSQVNASSTVDRNSPQKTLSSDLPSPPPKAKAIKPAARSALSETVPQQTTRRENSDSHQLPTDQVSELWQQGIASLSGMNVTYLANAESVTLEPPATFLAFFPAEMSRKLAEQAIPAMRQALQLLLGYPVHIQCRLTDPPVNTASSQSASMGKPAANRQGATMRQVSETPIVQRARELLGAKLIEVKGEAHE